MARLPYLKLLNVANNSLAGHLPDVRDAQPLQCGGTALELGGNAFNYDEARTVALLGRCRGAGAGCGDGLPPNSCVAFGGDFQVNLDDPSRCTDCGAHNWVVPLLIVLVVGLLGTGLVCFYVWLVTRHPSAMRKGISTASLVFTHLVTLTLIVGNLQLVWPPSVQAMVEISSFDFLSMKMLVRPECVAADAFGAEDAVYFHMHSLRFGVFLALLLSFSVAQLVLAARNHVLEARDARTSLAAAATLQRRSKRRRSFGGESSKPKMAFKASMEAESDRREDEAAESPPDMTGAAEDEDEDEDEDEEDEEIEGEEEDDDDTDDRIVAAALRARRYDQCNLWQSLVFQFQFLTACRYSLHIFSYADEQSREAKQALALGSILLVVNVLLAFRYYLWERALVFGTSFGASDGACRPLPPERLAVRMYYFTRRFRDEVPFWQFVIWGRQLLLLLDAFVPRWYLPFAVWEEELTTNATFKAVTLTHAGVAMAIFAAAWALHARVQPYAYVLQNRLESYLLFCNILTVALGAAYTFADGSAGRSGVIEGALVAVLIMSWGGAFGYIAWGEWKERRLKKPMKKAEPTAELPRAMTWAFRPKGSTHRPAAEIPWPEEYDDDDLNGMLALNYLGAHGGGPDGGASRRSGASSPRPPPLPRGLDSAASLSRRASSKRARASRASGGAASGANQAGRTITFGSRPSAAASSARSRASRTSRASEASRTSSLAPPDSVPPLGARLAAAGHAAAKLPVSLAAKVTLFHARARTAAVSASSSSKLLLAGASSSSRQLLAGLAERSRTRATLVRKRTATNGNSGGLDSGETSSGYDDGGVLPGMSIASQHELGGSRREDEPPPPPPLPPPLPQKGHEESPPSPSPLAGLRAAESAQLNFGNRPSTAPPPLPAAALSRGSIEDTASALSNLRTSGAVYDPSRASEMSDWARVLPESCRPSIPESSRSSAATNRRSSAAMSRPSEPAPPPGAHCVSIGPSADDTELTRSRGAWKPVSPTRDSNTRRSSVGESKRRGSLFGNRSSIAETSSTESTPSTPSAGRGSCCTSRRTSMQAQRDAKGAGAERNKARTCSLVSSQL